MFEKYLSNGYDPSTILSTGETAGNRLYNVPALSELLF